MNYSRKRNKQIRRREFLGLAWAVTLLGLFGQAGIGLFELFKPTIEPVAFGGLVVAGQLEEFEPGTVSHVREGRFYFSRLDDGGLMALWQRCPHLGCTVTWVNETQQFLCPCHASYFDAYGNFEGPPVPRPLDTFAVRIEEGQVKVDTATLQQRDTFAPEQLAFA